MRVIEKADVAPIEPLLCSIEAGAAIIGRSKRFIIDAIARGQLKAVKSDRRTLLVVQSLKDYVASLPPAKGTKNPRRHAVTATSRRSGTSSAAAPAALMSAIPARGCRG